MLCKTCAHDRHLHGEASCVVLVGGKGKCPCKGYQEPAEASGSGSTPPAGSGETPTTPDGGSALADDPNAEKETELGEVKL